jgi:predicted neuraminidase
MLKNINLIDVLFVALAMSLGWGFRGNYGHEYGAMVPGALVAIAACLISGREDWYKRVLYFGLFGAVGWAIGGQMSYGIIIGYTKSTDIITLLYGFTALYLEGFIWGGIGVGILALVLFLKRKQLTEMIFPFLAIFCVWSIVNIILLSNYGDTEPAQLDYYDTDWIAALGALAALVIVIIIQRKFTHATSLMLHLTIGWIIGILFFVTFLDWHLSPPRSDNWAGALGALIGLILFFIRKKYWAALYAALLVGLFSGLGFSTGQLFAVLGTATGIHIDWWKIMEQSFGFITGIGVAIAFINLRVAIPQIEDKEVKHDWGKGFALFFLLVVMTYVNLEKNVDNWINNGMVRDTIFSISTHAWFDIGYAILGLLVLGFIFRSQRNKLILFPESDLGKGYLLFLLILWWIIIGDQFNAFLRFNYVKLIVEGSFFISAILLSLWICFRKPISFTQFKDESANLRARSGKVLITLVSVCVVAVIAQTTLARISHNEAFKGHHIRFDSVTKKEGVLDKSREAVIRMEFIYEEAPFPSCHASTIAESKNGLVAAWFGGTDEGESDVGIWISRNDGQGWSDVVEVANGIQNESLRYPCWNPVLFQPKHGPLLLFYKVGPNPREWWGMLTLSDDGGKSWSSPQRLPDGFLGPIKNKPIQLPDESILCPSSRESKDDDMWKVHLEHTADLGKTWKMIGPLNDGKEFGAIQPTILTYPAGYMQILCRSRQKKITQCWSKDGSLTWSPMSVTVLPNPNSGIDAVTLHNGQQLLVYNHTTRGRSPLNIAVSEDGQYWKAGLILEYQAGEYSYPAVIQSQDGLVHITYTWKREKIKYVQIDPNKLVLQDMNDGKWPID